nr:unnamed protein product [Spirometra erinaceieuropaei]
MRQLRDGIVARVTENEAVLEAFAVTNEVKQGCVLAPILFSLMLSSMLMDAYSDERLGIRFAYRTGSHHLNQRRMHFQSLVSTTAVHELLFADDCALDTTSEGDMQRGMDLFAAACENVSLIVNTKKTVIMHQPPPDGAYVTPRIRVKNVQLTLSRNTKVDDEVAHRISIAVQAFVRLQTTLWNRQGLHVNIKPKMYKAVILPTLMHGAKSWMTYKNQVSRLNHFDLSCLRRILKLRLEGRIPDTDIQERTLRQLQLR